MVRCRTPPPGAKSRFPKALSLWWGGLEGQSPSNLPPEPAAMERYPSRFHRPASWAVGIHIFRPSDAGRKPPVCLAFAGLPAAPIRALGTSQSLVPLESFLAPGPTTRLPLQAPKPAWRQVSVSKGPLAFGGGGPEGAKPPSAFRPSRNGEPPLKPRPPAGMLVSYQRHETLTRAEAATAARRESGEAKETGGFRPASEGLKKQIPTARVNACCHWHCADWRHTCLGRHGEGRRSI